MKIAIAINTSWNIYNFRKGLLQSFLDQGHEVVAIAPPDEYSPKLEAMGCSYVPLPMSASGMNPLTDGKLLVQFYQVLRRERPDVLLSYTIKPNIYGALACKALGIPIIANVSGLGTVFLWKGYVKKLAVSLYSFAFRHASWVFFQNNEDQAEFTRFVKLDERKTSLLPGSGVDTQHFAQEPLPTAEVPELVMIARLLVEKGVYDFIEAIRLLRKKGLHVRFHLVGALDESHARSIAGEELATWQKEGLIRYTAHLEDVRPVIAQASAVVLPSYREGTPRTLLEAGAMGRPLIATDVPGCRHVVQDGKNGFLCKPQNPADLAAKIKLFLALSHQEQTEMAHRSRKFIEENFDQQLVIRQYHRKVTDLTGRDI
ncbi:glycosyltransferase family 4 protein [Marinoscillum furvescens]|uniref:Glycosyltransferase involved in cell wall biosynthesis n=1 Tax=Marinoscillum furvescens DSM 4134 TaxID=1122208 RepID=A0A3D9KZ33_MARFU|nr:glycosyltransferase family 4 protein [Marinoscillum furvescens]RED92848.1 glycosyltransferase involved in cell wall biosynthesis [Marinoscillum furvescens DSM 4134]